jgi:hypothetical protein
VDAAFRDVHSVGRELRAEAQRGFERDVEGAEVAVVNAVAVAA